MLIAKHSPNSLPFTLHCRQIRPNGPCFRSFFWFILCNSITQPSPPQKKNHMKDRFKVPSTLPTSFLQGSGDPTMKQHQLVQFIVTMTSKPGPMRKNTLMETSPYSHCEKMFLSLFLRSDTSWWLNQPIWKIEVKMGSSSPNRGEHKKYLKPPPRIC